MCMCDYVNIINQVYKKSNGGNLMGQIWRRRWLSCIKLRILNQAQNTKSQLDIYVLPI